MTERSCAPTAPTARRIFFLAVALALVVLHVGCGAAVSKHKASDNVRVHRYELSIANVYAVEGAEGVVIVDTGDVGDHEDVLEALSESNIERDEVRLIVITHAHADHTGAARALAKALEVPIAIEAQDAKQVATGQNPELDATNFTAVLLKLFLNDEYPKYTPDIAYQDCLDLNEYGVPGRVISAPGHTPGSSLIVLDGGHVLVGDLLAGGFFGGGLNASNPEEHYYQDDLEAVRAVIAWLTTSGATHLYPGHGGPLAIADVREDLADGEFGPQGERSYHPPKCSAAKAD